METELGSFQVRSPFRLHPIYIKKYPRDFHTCFRAVSIVSITHFTIGQPMTYTLLSHRRRHRHRQSLLLLLPAMVEGLLDTAHEFRKTQSRMRAELRRRFGRRWWERQTHIVEMVKCGPSRYVFCSFHQF
jgi:hypothetical protein